MDRETREWWEKHPVARGCLAVFALVMLAWGVFVIIFIALAVNH